MHICTLDFNRSPLKTDIYTLDRSGRIVLFDLPLKYNDMFLFSRSRNKPASKCIQRDFDMVFLLQMQNMAFNGGGMASPI